MIERLNWSEGAPATSGAALVPSTGGDAGRGADQTSSHPDWSGADQSARTRVVTVPSDGGNINVDIVNDARRMLSSGHWSLAEVRRHYSLSDAELAAAQRPAQSVQQSNRRSIERALADIDKLRRTDRSAYNKDVRLQARERALITQLESMKADSATDLVPRVDGEDGDLDVSWADPSLISEWRETSGVKRAVSVVRAAAEKAFAELDEHESYSLHESFTQLPSGAQSAIYGYLAVEPASWRPASEEDFAHFSNLEDTAPLLKEWGPNARAQLGVVLGRAEMMLGKMSAADRVKTEAWVDSLSPTQFRAAANALAR